MDGNQNFHPEAPSFARSRPDAYYAWLTSNGFPHRVAYDQTTAIFGAPKSPEEQQREAAAAAQRSQLGQAAGAVGGALLAGEAIRGFPNVGGLFTAAPTAGTGATTATGIGAGATSAGAAGTGAVTLAGSGVATIPAGAAVPAGYTAIGTSASGATMVAPTSMAGATTTGASTLGSIGSVALPVAVGAAIINNAWETGMKDIVRGRGDRADWTNQLANMTGVGAVANIGLRLAGKRSIGAMMKSGKSGAQNIRDDFRGDLKQSGVADDKYNVTLADGTKFNIGLDGKTKYQNAGENIDGKTTRNAWDVDWSNPLAKMASERIDPMIRNIYGDDNKKAKYFPGQFTGMLVNAATSNAKSEADVMANIEAILGKSKFAEQMGVGIQPPPPAKAPKGQVVRVSPGMYVNDKGQVKPAKSTRAALEANYNKSKEKEKK
jgi:hypothetical protein